MWWTLLNEQAFFVCEQQVGKDCTYCMLHRDYETWDGGFGMHGHVFDCDTWPFVAKQCRDGLSWHTSCTINHNPSHTSCYSIISQISDSNAASFFFPLFILFFPFFGGGLGAVVCDSECVGGGSSMKDNAINLSEWVNAFACLVAFPVNSEKLINR